MKARALTVVAAAVLVVGACTSKPTPPSPLPTLVPQPVSPSKIAPGTQGCTEVQNVGPYDPADENQLHVEQLPPLSTYPSQPPASGPHTSVPQPAGVSETPPDLAAAIHSLEHGAAVIWYAPGVTAGPGFAPIADFVAANGDHTIMAPYDYPDAGPDGALPEGTALALVAWERVQYCEDLSLEAVRTFLSSYRAPPLEGGTYIGNAPEAGVPI